MYKTADRPYLLPVSGINSVPFQNILQTVSQNFPAPLLNTLQLDIDKNRYHLLLSNHPGGIAIAVADQPIFFRRFSRAWGITHQGKRPLSSYGYDRNTINFSQITIETTPITNRTLLTYEVQGKLAHWSYPNDYMPPARRQVKTYEFISPYNYVNTLTGRSTTVREMNRHIRESREIQPEWTDKSADILNAAYITAQQILNITLMSQKVQESNKDNK